LGFFSGVSVGVTAVIAAINPVSFALNLSLTVVDRTACAASIASV
jgi:hypothetical protein